MNTFDRYVRVILTGKKKTRDPKQARPLVNFFFRVAK
jgi:hypothetical protein